MVTYTTINTAVKMLAKPIHVNMANLPRVRMLERMPVAIAATSVQMIVQSLLLARSLRPCESPMKPEPVAKLALHIDQIRNQMNVLRPQPFGSQLTSTSEGREWR